MWTDDEDVASLLAETVTDISVEKWKYETETVINAYKGEVENLRKDMKKLKAAYSEMGRVVRILKKFMDELQTATFENGQTQIVPLEDDVAEEE